MTGWPTREEVAREILRIAFRETERGIEAAMTSRLWPAERAQEAADAILSLFPAPAWEKEEGSSQSQPVVSPKSDTREAEPSGGGE